MAPLSPARLRHEDERPVLHRYLEEALARRYGVFRRIDSLGQRRCPYMSSFKLDEFDVQLEDATRVRLVMKDLSRDSMIEDARRARPDFLCDAEREIKVYRSVLPHGPAGTAQWYEGSATTGDQRHWLLLERVGGPPLWQVGRISAWKRAAAWIGCFHRSFSPLRAQTLATGAGALVYDADFYWCWMDRAQRFAAGDSARRRILDGVARQYEAAVPRLARLPRTIIHGEFYASNIVVGAGRNTRVCPVDWEMTALGPGLVDLAALTAGWAAPTQRALARAYLAASSGARSGKRVALPREFSIDLDRCRMYLAIRMLGWSDAWTPPASHAQNWLAEVVRLSNRLARAARLQ